MFERSVILRGLVLFAGAAVFSTVAWGGSAEIDGFGGGITLNGGGGTHGLYGGSAGFGIGSNLHLFGEFSYSTLASTAFSTTSGGITVTGNASVNLVNYGGGADYSFGSSRLRPYVIVAVGGGHFYASGSGSGNGVSANASMTVANSFDTGVGGGVRMYVGKHWGFKPEIRYQRYQSSQLSGNTALYTVGLFYQFGGE